jgi:hypothetical protein
MRYYNLPKDFDWKFYISYHKDLSLAGIETEKDAINHYFNHGRSENRIYKKIKNTIGENRENKENSWENFVSICKDSIPYLSNEFPIVDRKSNRKSLIIETRKLEHTEFVIKNTIQKLGDGWGHIVCCSTKNLDQIKSICGEISEDIEIRLLDFEITRNSYNNLLLDIDFWNGLYCEKVLIYQTDTFILNEFDNSFLQWDYIGAPWGSVHVDLIKKSFKIEEGIILGNGGLSLRSLDKMVESLGRDLNLELLNNNTIDTSLDKIPEDLYFSILNKKNRIPSPQRALDFSNEWGFSESSFGLHKPWLIKGDLNMEVELKKIFLQKRKKRIVFVSHEESRTGAPILLKSLIDYEVEKGDFDVWCITLRKGDEDWKYSQNIYYDEIPGKMDHDKVKWIQEVLNPDIVYANTIVSANFAKHFDCYKIISIHENRSLISVIPSLHEKLVSFDKILVGCTAIKEKLANIDLDSELTSYYLKFDEFDLKRLPNNESYIVSSGYVQLRKGVHRFIELAKTLPNKKFKWIGSTDGVEIRDNKITIKGPNFLLSEFKTGEPVRIIELTLDIPKNVEFLGLKTREENNNIIYNSECFLMLSSDDAFPLVTIEAKICGVPLVTLKESGDSYTICDERDLALERYDREKIVDYLNQLEEIKVARKINYDLIKRFNDNIEINRKHYADPLNKKIKVFLTINSHSPKFSYELLKKSIDSLQRFKYEIKVITDKINDYLLEAINDDTEIIEHSSKITDHIEKTFENYKQVSGTYLIFEVPKICVEKNYEDRFVLYCDYDIICNKDFSNLLPYYTKYLAVTPEWEKNNNTYFNAGIAWINVKNMLEKYSECESQILTNSNLETHDQSVLNFVLKNNWDLLDLRMNWKPYWGVNDDAYIIHYHWLKPNISLTNNKIKETINNIGDRIIDFESIEYYFEYWKNFKNQ